MNKIKKNESFEGFVFNTRRLVDKGYYEVSYTPLGLMTEIIRQYERNGDFSSFRYIYEDSQWEESALKTIEKHELDDFKKPIMKVVVLTHRHLSSMYYRKEEDDNKMIESMNFMSMKDFLKELNEEEKEVFMNFTLSIDNNTSQEEYDEFHNSEVGQKFNRMVKNGIGLE